MNMEKMSNTELRTEYENARNTPSDTYYTVTSTVNLMQKELYARKLLTDYEMKGMSPFEISLMENYSKQKSARVKA